MVLGERGTYFSNRNWNQCVIWSRHLLLFTFVFNSFHFFSINQSEEFIEMKLGTGNITSVFELHCVSDVSLLFGLPCTLRLSSKPLHFSYPFKSWDITANPSCAGTKPEQHGASYISQFTARGFCSQSGWIPLLDVHADTHQLCMCRRFYNCVFGKCSENSLLSASPDKVKTLFFSLPHIPSNTCLQLKASAEAYVKHTVTNLVVNILQNNPHYPLLEKKTEI